MMNRIQLLSIALLLIVACQHASAMHPGIDSTYIKPYPKFFSFRANLGIKEFSIGIKDKTENGETKHTVIYKPNNGLIAGVGFSFRNILLNFHVKVPNTELNPGRYGTTNIVDYHINITHRFIYLSAHHRWFNGLYVSNPELVDNSWTSDQPYPQRTDIAYTSRGIETIINFNPHRYSLNASLKATELQVRSAWSVLLYGNYLDLSVKGDSSLVPLNTSRANHEDSGIVGAQFSGFSVQPGVAYMKVHEKFYISPMVFAGTGIQTKTLRTAVGLGQTYSNSLSFRLGAKLNAGYNGNRYFACIQFDWNNNLFPDSEITFKAGSYSINLFAGFRF